MQMGAPQPCDSAYAIDGDTLRCSSIRLRQLGIDAPELTGHCPAYRACVLATALRQNEASWTRCKMCG